MIKIDARSSMPLYEQIQKNIKELIINGAIKSGDELPSIRELSSIVTINPNTVRRAYEGLEGEGVIEAIVERGIFIVKNYEPIFLEENCNIIKSKFKTLILEAKYLGFTEEELFKTFNQCLSFVEGRN